MTEFPSRHIGPRPSEIDHMLDTVGVATLEELLFLTVPDGIRNDELDLPEGLDEHLAQAELASLADMNVVHTSLIGQGYHGTITPPVIRRNLLENPAWYTAYTPYQPEISQGRLEALLNFQTMMSDLSGMDLSNASLLDEATAAAEAMTLLHRATKGRAGDRFLVDADALPQTIEVIETRAEPLGLEVVVGDPLEVDESCFGVLVQYPGVSGEIRELGPVVDAAGAAGARVAVAADPLALTLLSAPGEFGVDVVVGSAQRFGVPMGFGGPHAGYMSVRDDHRRSLPGRLVGVSVDAAGRPAMRLALQTREQHIRREKATSNICTAQVLLAVIAGMYGVYHGPEGLIAIAERVHRTAGRLHASLVAAGFEVNETFFDTLTVKTPGRTVDFHEAAHARHLNLRDIDADALGITVDETTDEAVLEQLAEVFAIDLVDEVTPGIPESLRRATPFMEHPVFHEHRSETEMLRYLRELSDKDVALDRAMIPLGSCTMKLNPSAAMEPISWGEFANVHPFAPEAQWEGYARMIDDLEAWLVEVTGYDAVSLQPNSGAQGEYAGLLAIRGYHRANGDLDRDVCLIPESAHGTNPASATMAGMRVVVVKCDENGNVDVEDLKSKLDAHADKVAALMVTYPSTHGVFEAAITEICDLVHEAGGQVYLDGANLNAMVGVAKPGRFGADVSHLNLHKTFTIPHGGGGPGVGPIGVREHLAPFLPGHRALDEGDREVGAIAAAPFGSAGILPIPWMYLRMMGPKGLRDATEMAILSANYIATRLDGAYDILYKGEQGHVAHECILDIRPITVETGVTVDDIAKRLIDFGFHAPTMSFPVAGTLMVEPTESEPLQELDRFCDAMLAIRAEVDAIGRGEVAHDDSPLAHAPHTAEDLLGTEWDRAYAREAGAYPAGVTQPKYWPPVSRVDNGYGDRHLVCACVPTEAYAEDA
jgi:glycine dehydrogenase